MNRLEAMVRISVKKPARHMRMTLAHVQSYLVRAYRVLHGDAASGMRASYLASCVRDMAETPTTPPLRPQPMARTPPRMRVQRYVQPGVTFANAISSTVIWEVDQRVSIGAAIREISTRTGVEISRIKLLTDRGPVNLKEDIDEDVAVLLLSE